MNKFLSRTFWISENLHINRGEYSLKMFLHLFVLFWSVLTAIYSSPDNLLMKGSSVILLIVTFISIGITVRQRMLDCKLTMWEYYSWLQFTGFGLLFGTLICLTFLPTRPEVQNRNQSSLTG